MSFNSNDNKGLLWGLMYEGGVFTNIPQNQISKVKDMFEEKINHWNNKPGTVLERNKEAMMEMVKELEILRTKPTLTSISERKYDIPGATQNAVTSNEIQSQRREVFNSNLKERQNDFNNMMSVKKPEKPDFSDDTPDNPPVGNNEMDKLLADMIAKRDLQLTNVSSNHDPNAAQEWITKDNNNPESFTNTIDTRGPPTLTIGESIDQLSAVENIRLDVQEDISNRARKVTFSEEVKIDTDSEVDFFSKFKKSERDNSEIIEEIKALRSEITKKLSKIDDLLVELS